MEYAEHIRNLSTTDPALAGELSNFTGLEQLLSWFPGRGIPLGALDMVTQDEFCHDLVAPLPDGRWLSFGLT